MPPRLAPLLQAMMCHVLALLERLSLGYYKGGLRGTINLSPTNAHRVLLTLCVISSKTLDDEVASQKSWASVGGITVSELNCLERLLLRAIDYQVLIPPLVKRSMQ